MNKTKSITAYFDGLKKWKEELLLLRDICRETELEESIKWGTPHYSINGKTIIGLTGFKNHFAVWFNQGVFLSDPKNKLINANENVTKGLRQWRFTSMDEIEPELLKSYILEAIENEKAGKRIKIERNKTLQVPDELKAALDANEKAKVNFKKLTPYKQREFSEYVNQAKRESTRISRTEKCMALIEQGIGLNDKYRS